ncbi:MAG: Rrf2 family transcriptional regulator [Acidobacteria bacterium]|nr:Rrf2 family transcriptional regulator [Acidobacteriota bacterium]
MISRDADYAVRLVLDLATGGKDTRRRIARRQAIPEGCLPRVTRALRRAGIVECTPGRGGGLSLRRAPGRISLYDVVAAADGGLALNRCLLVPSGCARVGTCAVHPHWRGVQERLVADLRAITFAEMAAAAAG